MKKLAVIPLLLVIAGCSKITSPNVTCGDESGLDVVREILSDATLASLKQEKNSAGEQLFQNSNIQGAIDKFPIQFAHFRTTSDANSRKVMCEAQVTYSIPSELLAQTEDGLKALQIASLSKLADDVGVEHQANTFSDEISYSLQPTDDGKSIYAETDTNAPIVSLAHTVVGAYLIKPVLDANNAQAANIGAALQDAAAAQQATPIASPAVQSTVSPTSAGPSFDCAKASTPVEKSICADPILSRLDRAMADNYSAMRNSDIGAEAREELKASQRQWAAARSSCNTTQCLADSYRTRINEICDYPVITGIHPSCIEN